MEKPAALARFQVEGAEEEETVVECNASLQCCLSQTRTEGRSNREEEEEEEGIP